jgi:hypothetical protein
LEPPEQDEQRLVRGALVAVPPSVQFVEARQDGVGGHGVE